MKQPGKNHKMPSHPDNIWKRLLLGVIAAIAVSCAPVEEEAPSDGVRTVTQSASLLEIDGDIGQIIFRDGAFFVEGWACQVGIAQSIKVHFYVDASAYNGGHQIQYSGTTTNLSGTANLPSEQAVSDRCQTSGVKHRFSVELPMATVSEYAGRKLWVHGLRAHGGSEIENRQLYRSGAMSIPDPEIVGEIQDVFEDKGQFLVRGWACQRGVSQSIRLHFYAGAAGPDNFLSGDANLPSETAVGVKCGTSGVNHRFLIAIPSEDLIEHSAKPLFVHGLRKYMADGFSNALLEHSGEYLIPIPEVRGRIDGIELIEDEYFINGWACQVGVAQSIRFHIYSEAAAGSAGARKVSDGLADFMASPDAESVVHQACGSEGQRYRFHLKLPNSLLQQEGGKAIYIHGLRVVNGTPNSALEGSGTFRFPSPVSAARRGCMATHYQFAADSERNAYKTPFVRPQGSEWTYVAWVWRETEDAETNHHFSVARSKNLKTWENTCGTPLSLPLDTNSATVLDPVSMGAGALNSLVHLSYDSHGAPIVSFHKYRQIYSKSAAPQITSQIYAARLVDDDWQVSELTDWTSHFPFEGGGSFDTEVGVDPTGMDLDGRLYQRVRAGVSITGTPATGTYYLNETNSGLELGEERQADPSPDPFLQEQPGGIPDESIETDPTNVPGNWAAYRQTPFFDRQWVSLRGDWNRDGSNQGGLFDRRMSRFYLRDGASTIQVSFGSRNHAYWPLIGNWGIAGEDSMGIYLPEADRYFLRNTLSEGAADEAYTGSLPEEYVLSDGETRWHSRSPEFTHLIKRDALPKNRDYPYDCNGQPMEGASEAWKGCKENFVTSLKYWHYDEGNARWDDAINIDRVWGSRVGFGFLVFKDYQIVVYYNQYRQIVVGLHREGWVGFEKKVLSSHVDYNGWDSHNTLTVFVDENHDIHIAGNQHRTPLNYWRSNGLNLDTIEARPMVGDPLKGDDIEHEVTYPEFFRGPNGDLLFTFRFGGSGNGIWFIYKYNQHTKEWEHLRSDKLPLFGGTNGN